MKKKIIAFIMSIVIGVSACCAGLFAYASDKSVNVNSALLDSILNDRYWIVETLVAANKTNNPYPSNSFMINETLENYQGNASFKALVDVMEHYGNADEYIQGLTDDALTALISALGVSDSNGAVKKLDKLIGSTDELKYESIINEVLKTDYTSSWGDTLFNDNMRLETLQQRAEIIKKLSSWQKELSEIKSITNTPSTIVIYDPEKTSTNDYMVSLEDYIGHFMDAYETDLGDYLNDAVSIPALNGNSALKKKVVSTAALASVFMYEKTYVDLQPDDYIYDLFGNLFAEETMGLLKASGKTLKLSNLTTNYAILLEALQSQNKETIDTMNRIAIITSDADLQKVMLNYVDLYKSAGDEKALAYETINNYLRNKGTISNFVINRATKGLSSIAGEQYNVYIGAQQYSLSSAVAKAAAIASLTTWVANEATGIEDAAKKIYICKYIDKIIYEVSKLYEKDLNNYKKNKTDENAEKVLSDLEYLKQLRLYGEKCAYGSMSAQMDSWIGVLLGGGETAEYLKQEYQESIDSILGCSLFPINDKTYTIPTGATLNINSQTMPNGKTETIASLKKSDGTFIMLGEADLKLMGGIDLNGASLNIYDAPNGFYSASLINSKSSGTVNIYCDNIAFGEIKNSGTTAINLAKDGASLWVSDSATNSGTLNINSSGSVSSVEIYEINNSGTISGNVSLNVTGNIKNNSIINSTVNINGDGNRPYETAYYKYERQYLSGSGTYKTIVFNNRTKGGVSVSGTSTVTDYVSDARTRIYNGQNVAAIGFCNIESGYKSAITVRDYTSPAYTKFNGDVYVNSTVSFPYSALFYEGLCLTSNCKTLTMPDDSDLNVNGDLKINSGKIVGNGILNLKGDMYITGSGSAISNLNFIGLTPQNGYLNYELTVDSLNNSNKSLSGVSIDSKINVTDSLFCSDDTRFLNGNNIVLKSTANVNNDIINGSITADGWICNRDKLEVKGTLKIINNVSLPNDLFVEKLEQQSGITTVGDNAVINSFKQTAGTITFGNNAKISENDLNQSGTLNIGNNSIIILKKVTNSKNINLGDNTVLNCETTFVNTGEMSGTGIVILNDDSKLNSLNGGNYEFNNGDITANSSVTANCIKFSSNVPQRYSGPSSSTVENLEINNTSKSGFILSSVIHVTEKFINNSNRIDDIRNIYLDYADGKQYAQESYDEQTVINGNLVFDDYTIIEIKDNVQVNGNVTIPSTSKLIVSSDGSLNAKGSITATSAMVNIIDGGKMRIGDYLSSSTSTFNVDGELIIVGDAKLTSSTLSGNGLISFMGDLITTDCSWNKPNVSFCGKTPQEISGSAISVNNLIVDNTSKSGISFNTTVDYYGRFNDSSSVINGSNYLVSKA